MSPNNTQSGHDYVTSERFRGYIITPLWTRFFFRDFHSLAIMDTIMDEQALIRFISTTETAAVGPVLHSALAKLAPEQLLLQFIQLFSHVADFSNRLDESIAAAWHYFGDNEVWRPSFHSLQAFKVA